MDARFKIFGREDKLMAKVSFVGDKSTGKTTLIHSFAGYKTPAFAYETAIKTEDDDIKVQINDQYLMDACQDSPLTHFKVDLICVVFSLESQISFNNVIYWLNEAKIKAYAHTRYMLVGTKADIARLDDKMITAFADVKHLQYVKVSGKTSAGMDQLRAALTKELLSIKKVEISNKQDPEITKTF